MFGKERLPYHYRHEEKPEQPDFGTSIVPRPIEDIINKHGDDLIGEIVGTRSGTYYVIRGISHFAGRSKMRALRATQLGDFTKSRPHVVFMPENASAYISNFLKEFVLANNMIEYRKILQEINDEGGNIEIPPVKKSSFDIF